MTTKEEINEMKSINIQTPSKNIYHKNVKVK